MDCLFIWAVGTIIGAAMAAYFGSWPAAGILSLIAIFLIGLRAFLERRH
jgi:uncharacterized membrane protein YfcA